MDGALLLIILIPLIVLILLVAILSKASANQQMLESLKNKLGQLKNQLSDIEMQIRDLKTDHEIKRSVETKKDTRLAKPETDSNAIIFPKQERPVPVIEEKTDQAAKNIIPLAQENFATDEGSAAAAKEEQTALNEKLRDVKTDLEKIIGENFANKIGIAVLVLG